jgi:hypothetical protein
MDFGFFSLSLVASFAIVRFVTEQTNFHLRFKGLWIHHWILAAVAMLILIVAQIEHPIAWGALTGAALDGLIRKNWSIIDR